MITCTFEDGGQTSLRHLTVNGIIIRNNQLLLGKRGTFKGQPLRENGKWGLTGGYVDRDETLVEAITREIKEETDLEVANITFFRIIDNPFRRHDDAQNIAVSYIIEVTGQEKLIDEEVTELRWFNLDNLPPDEEMAFDHKDDIELFKQYLLGKIKIPVLG